jgi:ribosomal protein S18 acetylase RimI-like enzyme
VARTEIRQASSNDLPQILMLSRRQLGDSRQHPFLRRAMERDEIVIATGDVDVIGYAVWNREFYECAFVWMLQVRPESRRQGIARALIQKIEREVGAGGRLFTSTNESNLIAQRTFRALGFRRSGVIDNLDPDDPEIVYFKQL